MEDGLLAPEHFDEQQAFSLLKDDFFDLANGNDIGCLSSEPTTKPSDNSQNIESKQQATMDNWDQDVLLSNASLPETNPLLELDNSMEEDFQKMLNEWENHIGSLQTNDMNDVDMSSLVSSEEVPSAVGGSHNHRGGVQPDPMLCEEVKLSSSDQSKSEEDVSQGVAAADFKDQVEEVVEEVKLKQDHSEDGSSEDGVPKVRLTLGKTHLAGIVISSGPGGHFETYEGTKAAGVCPVMHPSSSSSSSCKKNVYCCQQKEQHDKNVNKPQPSFNTYHTQNTTTTINNITTTTRTTTTHAKNSCPHPNISRPTTNNTTTTEQVVNQHDQDDEFLLPGAEWGAAILEATDADNLLEKFEATAVIGGPGESPSDSKKSSQIIAAVQNHFATSTSPSSSTSSSTLNGARERKHPKIVPSQRIKDALPKEIIEKIKASSQRSRTIAIIEPVHHGSNKNGSNNTTKTPALFSSSSTSASFTSPYTGTRFQEAASSLNRNKQLRQQMNMMIPTPSPQQVQINLDHDYCSSTSKMKRSRLSQASSVTSMSSGLRISQQQTTRLQPTIATSTTASGRKPAAIVVSSPAVAANNNITAKPVVRVTTTCPSPYTTTTSVQVPALAAIKPELMHHQQQQPKKNTVLAVDVSVRSLNEEEEASSPLSSPASQDTRKDSGLESGEVSDASDGHHDNSSMYSKVPPYLTAINVTNADSRSVSVVEDTSAYDRLPAYVKGVATRSTSAKAALAALQQEQQQVASASTSKPLKVSSSTNNVEAKPEKNKSSSSSSSSSKKSSGSEDHVQTSPMTTRRRARQRTTSSSSRSSSSSSDSSSRNSRSSSSSSSSSAESDGERGMTTRSRTSSASPVKGQQQRRRRQSSSSSSSGEMAPTKTRKRRRSWRKGSSSQTNCSSSNIGGNKATTPRSPSCSPPPSRRRRLTTTQRSPMDKEVRRRQQERRQQQQSKQRQVEERRVVYVGRIVEGTTRAHLRNRFEVFGPIEEISVHFRDRGDNYGFVTFRYKVDAFAAIEHGNDDPAYPKVDLCFGGRRAFCKEKYADLDSLPPGERLTTSSSAVSSGHNVRSSTKKKDLLDFDSLLQQARAGISKK